MVMDSREQRGLAIAAKFKLIEKGGTWLVPSQSQDGEKYTVIPGTKCSYPDHEVRQVKCKHLWAVEYGLARETAQDGTVTETETGKVTRVTRKTYPSDWLPDCGSTADPPLFSPGQRQILPKRPS